MNDLVTIFVMFAFRIVGIIGWAFVFFLTMEVVICRDARQGNIHRILNSPLRIRWKMFKKSLRSRFYTGTLLIFVSSLLSIVGMVTAMWLGVLPKAPYTWTLVSIFLPIGILLVYYSLGYRITLFQKFKLFLADEHD